MKYSCCAAHPADTRPDTILKCFRKSIKPSPNNPRRDKTRQTGDYPRVIEGRNSDLPLSLDSASVFRFDLVCDEILWSSLSPIPQVSLDVKVSFCLCDFAENPSFLIGFIIIFRLSINQYSIVLLARNAYSRDLKKYCF